MGKVVLDDYLNFDHVQYIIQRGGSTVLVPYALKAGDIMAGVGSKLGVANMVGIFAYVRDINLEVPQLNYPEIPDELKYVAAVDTGHSPRGQARVPDPHRGGQHKDLPTAERRPRREWLQPAASSTVHHPGPRQAQEEGGASQRGQGGRALQPVRPQDEDGRLCLGTGLQVRLHERAD